MIKNFTFLILGLISVCFLQAQTNPVAQTIPFSLTAQTGSTLPAGIALHRFGTSSAAVPTTRILSPGNADLPYNATSTSGGWKDEAANGISILASSSQSAGACIVSINTIGKTNIQVQWSCRLILQQASKDNSVALQYRLGTSGNFTDIGSSTTFSSTGQIAGYSQSYTETLPVAAENQTEVQVRWIYWESAGATGSRDRIALDEISITSGSVACTEPTSQPTTLGLTPATNSISGSFTASSPAADAYIVVRSLSSSLSSNPVDGTSYSVGQALGGGTVVSSDILTSFTDNGLVPNTLYYYFIFAYNNTSCTGGPNYLTTTPLTNSATTLSLPGCTTPVAPPTNLNLIPGGTTISGTFTAEPTANNYLVVYSQNSSLGFTPANGTTYTNGQVIGQDIIAYYGSNTAFIISGLNILTTYHIFIFSANGTCTGEPYFYTSSLNGTATTTNGGIPVGYYDAAVGLNCQQLKTALRNIIANGHIALSYSSIDDIQMPIVDTIRSDDGLSSIIWDIYSNNNSGPEPFTFSSAQNANGGFCVGGATPGTEGGCWNKEHSFPRSWFKLSGSAYQQPTEADLFIVRPTDSKINGNRGNIPYSTVSTTTYQFPTAGAYPGYPMPPNPVLDKIGVSNYPGVTASSAFEPNDAVKGDIARAYFYILTRYENELSNWVTLNGATSISTVVDGTTNGGIYPSFQTNYLKLMNSWNNLDPVDAKEINRNNLIYSQQNNRNPYIDHPEYVALVWQCTGVLPVTIIDFTASKLSESVLLKWYATYETNFKLYQIERSTDGIIFNTIGEVAGKNWANYSFVDNKLPSNTTLYYRIKMLDLDGKFSYSKTISFHGTNHSRLVQVFPNPSEGKFTVKLNTALAAPGQILIKDITGRLVAQQAMAAGQKQVNLNLSQLASGRYFIHIFNNGEWINESVMITK